MTLDSYTPAQISAFWAGVTGITAVGTGIVAVVSLLSLRRDSRDRSRPVLSAELLPLTLSQGTCELVVQNVGRSVAKNIRLTFEPPITEDMGIIAGYLARRYSHVIPTMGPGRRLTNIYGNWRGDGSDELDESIPKEVTAIFMYQDSHERAYEDRYDLTVQTLRNQTSSFPSSTDEKGMRKREVRALEAIARGVNTA
jgi:hypothetical protein